MKSKIFALVLGIMMFVSPAYADGAENYSTAYNALSELIFYKDSSMTERYDSPDDIPYGEKVYYEVVSKPGYICYNLEIDVYEITDTYFVNEYAGVELDFALNSILAGDTDFSGTYTLKDTASILKYIAGYTVEYWTLGKSGFGECIMDYNCDGKVNLIDAAKTLKAAAGYEDDRVSACPKTYNILHRLPLNVSSFLSNGPDFWCDNGYVVWSDHSRFHTIDIPESIAAQYDKEFFEKYDLVVFSGMCAGEVEPVIENLWYDSFTRYLRVDFECSNITFGDGYVVLVAVEKSLNVKEAYPV